MRRLFEMIGDLLAVLSIFVMLWGGLVIAHALG